MERVSNDENGFYSYRELADMLVEYVKYMGYTHIELLRLQNILLTVRGDTRLQDIMQQPADTDSQKILCILWTNATKTA